MLALVLAGRWGRGGWRNLRWASPGANRGCRKRNEGKWARELEGNSVLAPSCGLACHTCKPFSSRGAVCRLSLLIIYPHVPGKPSTLIWPSHHVVGTFVCCRRQGGGFAPTPAQASPSAAGYVLSPPGPVAEATGRGNSSSSSTIATSSSCTVDGTDVSQVEPLVPSAAAAGGSADRAAAPAAPGRGSFNVASSNGSGVAPPGVARKSSRASPLASLRAWRTQLGGAMSPTMLQQGGAGGDIESSSGGSRGSGDGYGGDRQQQQQGTDEQEGSSRQTEEEDQNGTRRRFSDLGIEGMWRNAVHGLGQRRKGGDRRQAGSANGDPSGRGTGVRRRRSSLMYGVMVIDMGVHQLSGLVQKVNLTQVWMFGGRGMVCAFT